MLYQHYKQINTNIIILFVVTLRASFIIVHIYIYIYIYICVYILIDMYLL